MKIGHTSIPALRGHFVIFGHVASSSGKHAFLSQRYYLTLAITSSHEELVEWVIRFASLDFNPWCVQISLSIYTSLFINSMFPCAILKKCVNLLKKFKKIDLLLCYSFNFLILHEREKKLHHMFMSFNSK